MNLRQEKIITKDYYFNDDLTTIKKNIKEILNEWDYYTQISGNQLFFTKESGIQIITITKHRKELNF